MDAAPRARRSSSKFLLTKASIRVEDKHPAWLVQHSLGFGWLWTAFWAALLIPADHFQFFGFFWGLFIILGPLPSFISTVACLSQTPHARLKRGESVLTHFFSQFAKYVLGFTVWIGSIVLSAFLALDLQATAGKNQLDTLTDGANVLLGFVPVAAIILWAALIVRYSWFLARLRGWRAHPVFDRIPESFLADAPQTRAVVIGLAHPGLLLASGMLGTGLTLLLVLDDVTLHVIH